MTPDPVAKIVRDVAALPVLNVPALRRVRRRWSRELKAADAGAIHRIAIRLVRRPDWASRMIGWELVAGHPAARDRLTARLVERLGLGLSSWGEVDAFGCSVTGPAWREGRIPDRLVIRWARSRDRWRRRLALVSTVPLNLKARGGSGDARRTLAICSLLLDDRDDMVVKGLSWALRALARRHPTAVARFVSRHQDRLAPRARREVNTMLRTGRKTDRLDRPGAAVSDTGTCAARDGETAP